MIILTGFEPYGKNEVNVSGEIVKKIELSNFDIPLVKKIFSVNWNLSLNSLKSLIIQIKLEPTLLILTGIHESKKFKLEKLGWNFAFGKDNNNRFKLGLIRYNSPLMIKSILNFNKLILYLPSHNNIKISISNYPGIYLCNYLYYWALLLSRKKYPVVFIHVPYKIELNMGIEVIEKLIDIIISTHSNIIQRF